MRVERKQLELLAEAVALSDASEFDVRVEDGRVSLFAVETVEKLTQIPTSPQGVAQRRRQRVTETSGELAPIAG